MAGHRLVRQARGHHRSGRRPDPDRPADASYGPAQPRLNTVSAARPACWRGSPRSSCAMAEVMRLLIEGRRVALALGGNTLAAMALAARDLKEGRRTNHPELVL